MKNKLTEEERNERDKRITAFGLWRFADEYLEAARLVRPVPQSRAEALRQGVSIPAYYLVGHSIELSLKAFLRARGVPLDELASRVFGHNLDKLLIEARRRKLGREVRLTNFECFAIRLLNATYAYKELEYIVTGGTRYPEYPLIATTARKLVNGLGSHCYRKTFGEEPPQHLIARAHQP